MESTHFDDGPAAGPGPRHQSPLVVGAIEDLAVPRGRESPSAAAFRVVEVKMDEESVSSGESNGELVLIR